MAASGTIARRPALTVTVPVKPLPADTAVGVLRKSVPSPSLVNPLEPVMVELIVALMLESANGLKL